jgi:dihydroflavonol-4-reductase
MKERASVILVTGATGFLGRNLCPYLVARGHRVRALVRPASDTAFLSALGVDLAFGDVRDATSVRQAVQGCRSIMHAAGKFRFWGQRVDFFQVNFLGTANVIEAALGAGVERFLYISTIAVAGAPRSDQLLDEQMRCEPQDDYQRSKLQTEQLVLARHRMQGLPAIILRPGAYYGPWGRYAFNRMFFEDPLKGLPIGVHWGRRLTFPVFVPDLVRVIEAALTRGRVGEIYHVAGPSLTHAEVHRTISRLAGIRPWRVNPPAFAIIGLARLWTWLSRWTRREPYYSINMAPYVFCDWNTCSDKARRELGFEPTPFEEGARQTIDWYRQQGIGLPHGLGRLIVRLWSVERGE